jgi:hypothetical protein
MGENTPRKDAPPTTEASPSSPSSHAVSGRVRFLGRPTVPSPPSQPSLDCQKTSTATALAAAAVGASLKRSEIRGTVAPSVKRETLSPLEQFAQYVPPAKPPEPTLTYFVAAEEVKPAQRVQHVFKQLSEVATDLNRASDELSKPIGVCEVSLKKLNLGVPAWVTTSKGTDERGEWWDRGIGYTRLKGLWSISLRTRLGDQVTTEEEVWAFNEAPRWLRIEAVAKLPELLDALLRQAQETTTKIRARIAQTNELAEAIRSAAEDIPALERK